MIDSHCHLDIRSPETPAIIERARAAGIKSVLAVACAWEEYDFLIRLLNDYPNIYGSFGLHPEFSDTEFSDVEFIDRLMAHPRLVGVGECGLDYHYMPQDKSVQRATFERQISLSHRTQKPLIIHTREADSDTIDILTSAFRAGLLTQGGVLHCFTGTQQLAETALEIGFYVSASGVITFKNADSVRSVFQTIPTDRLLIETDSPYMAPVPYRGHPNEPAFLARTAEQLAVLKGMTVSELERITTNNFNRLFHTGGASHAN